MRAAINKWYGNTKIWTRPTNSVISFHTSPIGAWRNYSNKVWKCISKYTTSGPLFDLHYQCHLILRVLLVHVVVSAFLLCTIGASLKTICTGPPRSWQKKWRATEFIILSSEHYHGPEVSCRHCMFCSCNISTLDTRKFVFLCVCSSFVCATLCF